MTDHRTRIDGSSALADVADGEAEYGKDIWDVRCIPGARYADYDSQHLLRFTDVPGPFRPVVKQFVRMLLLSGRTRASCALALLSVRAFLTFFVGARPDAQELCALGPADIEAYLGHLRATPYRDGRERRTKQINRYVCGLAQFLAYLQRMEHPLAPMRPLRQIIWPEHLSAAAWYQSREDVAFIPAMVMEQLDQQLQHLRPKYIPLVILLRASGWRISDVLNLRYDTCLERTERGWALCGDIQKTRVLGHKVPITAEVAAVVQAQCDWVARTVPPGDNPKRYLFPATTCTGRPSRFRRGCPVSYGDVLRTLNRLAVTRQIRGPDGALFHFRTHAFRHSKAVELINNGMSLVTVQQWLAHASPEMTLAYAKILDTTMQRQWEEAMARGAVRITEDGRPYAVPAEALTGTNDLELARVRGHLDAIRLPNGYCFKHQKFDCPAARMPCYTCPMFATTPQFLPQFLHEVRDTEYQVELGQAAGHPHWVEANRRKLTVLQPIVQLLQEGQTHHPLGKTTREYAAEQVRRSQQEDTP
jgi:integrase